MKIDFAGWQRFMLIAMGALCLLALVHRVLEHLRGRRQRRKRIAAARVRSGHMPLDMPTTRGTLLHPTAPGSLPEASGGGAPDRLVVDEQPRIHIRYLDPHGRYAERTILVETLDLHRQAIIARGDSLHDPRIFPLERIAEARSAHSGQPFNLGLWVDAVRVARRQREVREASQWGTLA